MVEPENTNISIVRQCELLDLHRRSYYYESCPTSAEDAKLMRLIDEQYLITPFYGFRRMTAWLKRKGYNINHKRVRRLMKLMGIQAIYQKPRLSVSSSEHKKYPYLLRGLDICVPDQVWCSDITYGAPSKGIVGIHCDTDERRLN